MGEFRQLKFGRFEFDLREFEFEARQCEARGGNFRKTKLGWLSGETMIGGLIGRAKDFGKGNKEATNELAGFRGEFKQLK